MPLYIMESAKSIRNILSSLHWCVAGLSSAVRWRNVPGCGCYGCRDTNEVRHGVQSYHVSQPVGNTAYHAMPSAISVFVNLNDQFGEQQQWFILHPSYLPSYLLLLFPQFFDPVIELMACDLMTPLLFTVSYFRPSTAVAAARPHQGEGNNTNSDADGRRDEAETS